MGLIGPIGPMEQTFSSRSPSRTSSRRDAVHVPVIVSVIVPAVIVVGRVVVADALHRARRTLRALGGGFGAATGAGMGGWNGWLRSRRAAGAGSRRGTGEDSSGPSGRYFGEQWNPNVIAGGEGDLFAALARRRAALGRGPLRRQGREGKRRRRQTGNYHLVHGKYLVPLLFRCCSAVDPPGPPHRECGGRFDVELFPIGKRIAEKITPDGKRIASGRRRRQRRRLRENPAVSVQVLAGGLSARPAAQLHRE